MSNRTRKTNELLPQPAELPEPPKMDSTPSGFQPVGDGPVVQFDGASIARPKSTYERLKEDPQDPRAWMDMREKLVRVHFPRQFGNSLNYMEYEDLAHDTMDKFIEKIDVADSIGYVYTIANNLAKKRIKENQRWECLSAEEEVADGEEGASRAVPEKAKQAFERHKHDSEVAYSRDDLQVAIGALSEADRGFYIDHIRFENSYRGDEDVNRAFGLQYGLTVEAVRQRLCRIRKRMRDMLKKMRHDAEQ